MTKLFIYIIILVVIVIPVFPEEIQNNLLQLDSTQEDSTKKININQDKSSEEVDSLENTSGTNPIKRTAEEPKKKETLPQEQNIPKEKLGTEEAIRENPKIDNQQESQIAREILESLKIQNNQILKMNENIKSLNTKIEEQNAKISILEKYHIVNEKKETKKDIPTQTRWEVVKRSAVLPGWGQFYAERNIFGSLYSTLFVASLINYNQKWNNFHKTKSEYQDFTLEFLLTANGSAPLLFFPPIVDKGDRYKMDARESNNAAYLVIGIYLINLLDAFFTSNSVAVSELSPFESKQRSGLEFSSKTESLLFGRNGISENNTMYELEYVWRF